MLDVVALTFEFAGAGFVVGVALRSPASGYGRFEVFCEVVFCLPPELFSGARVLEGGFTLIS